MSCSDFLRICGQDKTLAQVGDGSQLASRGEKLSALFDGQKYLADKLDGIAKCLQRIEEKYAGHDVKIEVLNKTKNYRRNVKKV